MGVLCRSRICAFRFGLREAGVHTAFKEDSYMKKKLISLLLCIVMLLSFVLASCNISTGDGTEEGGDDIRNEGVRTAMTLVWALVCEEIPSEATQKTIEDAVNKITEARYMTHIALEFFTEDGYSEAMEERMLAQQEEKERREAASKAWKKFVKANRVIKYEDGSTYKVETEKLYEQFWESFPQYEKYVQPEETTDEDYTETEAETVLNDWGIGVLAYPEPEEYQIDILYISGYNDYYRYIKNEWIASLDAAISEDAGLLSDYIFPAFMTAAQTMYGTYAIPNNRTIGDYTYLLLHKGLIEKYYYVVDDITSLTSTLCQDFLYDVANSESEEFVPLLDNEATRSPQNIRFWNLDYVEEDGMIVSQSCKNQFSILGSTYGKHITQMKETDCVYQCMIILEESNYTSQLKTLKQYEVDGYYGAGAAETRQFAAGIVTGDLIDLIPKYSDDYHMVVIDYPRGTEEDLFEHMWAVSDSCKDVSRAMEIITYLNTNADFRNLIQYGIKDVHYTVNYETGVAERLNNDYLMDIYKTGNVFIAYPEQGMDPEAWTYGKLQNQNAKVDLAVGFSVADTDEVILNKNGLDAAKKFSAMFSAAMDLCKTPDDINLLLNGFTVTKGEDLNALTDLQKLLIEYNEITDWSKDVTVTSLLNLAKSDKYLNVMTNNTYEPDGEFKAAANGEPAISNAEEYGPGASFHFYYIKWAKQMKFVTEDDDMT